MRIRITINRYQLISPLVKKTIVSVLEDEKEKKYDLIWKMLATKKNVANIFFVISLFLL